LLIKESRRFVLPLLFFRDKIFESTHNYPMSMLLRKLDDIDASVNQQGAIISEQKSIAKSIDIKLALCYLETSLILGNNGGSR